MSELTLSWTTTVEENHQITIEVDDLPEVLANAIKRGVNLDNTMQLITEDGVHNGTLSFAESLGILDALDEFIVDNEGAETRASVGVTDRSLDSWEVEEA